MASTPQRMVPALLLCLPLLIVCGTTQLAAQGQSTHPGLDERCRDNGGSIRQKDGNTRVDTLRETQGDNFAPGVRGDMHLNTLLERTDKKSLRERLKNRDT